MKSNKEIRGLARQELKGFWTMPVLKVEFYEELKAEEDAALEEALKELSSNETDNYEG